MDLLRVSCVAYPIKRTRICQDVFSIAFCVPPQLPDLQVFDFGEKSGWCRFAPFAAPVYSMSDGYLVSLLFNGACKTIPDAECFGAEDDIRRADSATSADFVSVSPIRVYSSPQWNRFALEEKPECRTPSAFSACVAAIARESKNTDSDSGTPRIASSSGSAVQSQLIYGASASYLNRRSIEHLNSLASGRTESAVSERLQSCLQTDDLNLQGFHSQPSSSPFDQHSPSSFRRSYDNKTRLRCRCHPRPLSQVSTSCRSLPRLLSGDVPPSGSRCCQHSRSASILHLAAGLGEAGPLILSPGGSKRIHPSQAALTTKEPSNLPDNTESSIFHSPAPSPPNYSNESHQPPSPQETTVEADFISNLFNPKSKRREDEIFVAHESIRTSLSTTAETSIPSPSSSTFVAKSIPKLTSQPLESPPHSASAPPLQPRRSSTDRIAEDVCNPGLATALSGLWSGKAGGRTLIPGKYAPRHLAAAAVAVPAKICRKFRASRPPPVIPEEPECGPSRSNSNPTSSGNSAIEVSSSFKDPPCGCKPLSETSEVQPKRQQLALARRRSSDSAPKRQVPFVTIPCIQGALSVRHTGSTATAARAAAAAATTAATAASRASACHFSETAPGKCEGQKGWASRLRRLSSSSENMSAKSEPSPPRVSRCWKNVVGWGGVDDAGRMWGFLEAAEYEEDAVHMSMNLATPSLISEEPLAASGVCHGSSPICSQESTTASQSFTTTISSSHTRRVTSSQRSVRRQVGSGVILGTGDPEHDRACSNTGLHQYINVARSIRRISRAFHLLVSEEGAQQILANTPPSLRRGVYCDTPISLSPSTRRPEEPTKKLQDRMNSTCSECTDSSYSNGCSADNERSPCSCPYYNESLVDDRAECACSESESSIAYDACEACCSTLPGASQSNGEPSLPCKAACWAEVLIFIQSIFRLQLRQKKLKTKAVAAHLLRKRQLATIRTLDLSEGSTKASSRFTKASSHGTAVPSDSCVSGLRPSSNERNIPPAQVPDSRVKQSGLDGERLRNGTLEDAEILSSSYWIVFVALWIEKRMHLVSRQRGDPSLIQQFCCCRLFTPADLKVAPHTPNVPPISHTSSRVGLSRMVSGISASTSGSSLFQSGVYFTSPSQHQPSIRRVPTVNSTASLCSPDPNKIQSPQTGCPRSSFEIGALSTFQSSRDLDLYSAPCNAGRCCSHTEKGAFETDCQTASKFRMLEALDLHNEAANFNAGWGPQIDTIRRFLVLCFCAWR